MRDFLLYTAIGAGAGAGATLLVWLVIESKLKDSIRREVGSEIDRKLASAGLDRQTGQRLAAALQAADTIGLIGIPR